jgi:hypothetical protein
MVNLKNLIISKKKGLYIVEEFYEKNISAQQFKTEKNPWFFRENEYQKWPERFETEKNEGKEKVNCLKAPTRDVCFKFKIRILGQSLIIV